MLQIASERTVAGCWLKRLGHWLLPVTLLLFLLGGCAPHRSYRTDYQLCESAAPQTECAQHALQAYRSSDPAEDYLLNFIEFDDQGQLFNRRQMDRVIDSLLRGIEQRDYLLVVFVHGWKHSAAPGDGNIRTFREALKRISLLESELSRGKGRGIEARQVVGVYLGWRGGSLTLPFLKQLTFWDRKETAHKVGHGAVSEVLNRLENVRNLRSSFAGEGNNHTRLIVIGHSFGGAVVHSALTQILQERFIHTLSGPDATGDVGGFGDLVVLINPAFEALRYTSLSDMSSERGTYFKGQLPVLAILTSEADDATRVAFPAGRWLATMFEKEKRISRFNAVTGEDEVIKEGSANVTAVGHFRPYRTHRLEPATTRSADSSPRAAARLFYRASGDWENDESGSQIEFAGSVLKRTKTSAGRNPYLVVQVDDELIHDHNHIDDPRIISFIQQLVLISSQHQLLEKRRDGR